ncbi:MAG TPA: DUF445 domain-containing protein [Niabella sp.]|nr:DUF445 domain-containing protein [Niabella sp.]HQX21212.1 DUF445 domain-containing protein [Niabella sp.]HRB07898.1 DUF445 domain-containing protein [Niabella sp.]HRB43895.1 DUF445 domain-containing protein [Niabella sp.]HRB62736.1 DUF445 domain-containing protein [Niabella sp.]
MVIIYIATTWILKTRNEIVLGCIKAFAEAAMIGALADWFAVTALFHHPLGIRIPHTNLIERRKKTIGNNLGGFVVDNFLNAATIRPYIEKISISTIIIHWFGKAKNATFFVDEISRLLKRIISNTDDIAITNFINHKSREIIKEIELNRVIASGMDIVIARGDHIRLFDYLTCQIREYVLNNESLIRERVKQESHFLIPDFVDNIIASKITTGISKYLTEIENDPNHKIRTELNLQVIKLVADIRTQSKWKEEFQVIKNSIIQSDKIEQYALSIWKHLQRNILADLDTPESAIKQYLKKSIEEIVVNLQSDKPFQQKLNKWAQFHSYKYILQNTEKAGELISSTVGNWEGKELSYKLELEVGKDLQYIRVNGTLVGGLVGLLIYALTHFIQNS